MQQLNDLELYVYDAVASADTQSTAVGDQQITEIAESAGTAPERVRRALDRLVELNHVRHGESGYSLGPHDWAP
jgi:DNA-binding IclR family transcriptional regulator